MILAFVFIYAGIIQIVDADSFSQSVYIYKLLPDVTVNIIAVVLPWIELCTGLLLLFGISVKENSFLLTGMLMIFIFAIAISLLRGLNIECGCFGTVNGAKVGISKIIENIGLVIIGLILIKFDSDFLSLKVKEN